jgi:3-deoxy-D-manno-octulosonic-acid transferase
MIKTRFGYTLLLYALLPRTLLHLLWRARRQPEYLKHIPERFGYYGGPVPSEPLIWVHAVSVGETRAAEPLIRSLWQKYPGHRVLLTHMTPTGRETAEELFGGRVLSCYLPYDFPRAAARFLGRFRPEMGVMMETEIWPNLVHECNVRKIPLYLVNARLSEKSFLQYRRIARLAQSTLREFGGIAAQSHDDAQRLVALGASSVVITGNLKFDVIAPAGQTELGATWRSLYGPARAVLLAASTRDGEEEILLDQLDRIDVPSLLMVIVPRHPQRFDSVAATLERRGIRYQRRSANDAIATSTRVVLGDSMGEMFAYYAACDIAFIGGSLRPFGGQNLIEACVAGKPVLIGPHTYNFAEATELAIAAGVAIRVQDERECARTAHRLLNDRDALSRMADAARVFSRAHQGATQRTMDVVGF